MTGGQGTVQSGLDRRLTGQLIDQIVAHVVCEILDDVDAEGLAHGQCSLGAGVFVDQRLQIGGAHVHQVGELGSDLLVSDGFQALSGDGVEVAGSGGHIVLGGHAEGFVGLEGHIGQT